jgi:hypothetical protein
MKKGRLAVEGFPEKGEVGGARENVGVAFVRQSSITGTKKKLLSN